jgi:hypothetical protein
MIGIVSNPWHRAFSMHSVATVVLLPIVLLTLYLNGYKLVPLPHRSYHLVLICTLLHCFLQAQYGNVLFPLLSRPGPWCSSLHLSVLPNKSCSLWWMPWICVTDNVNIENLCKVSLVVLLKSCNESTIAIRHATRTSHFIATSNVSHFREHYEILETFPTAELLSDVKIILLRIPVHEDRTGIQLPTKSAVFDSSSWPYLR